MAEGDEPVAPDDGETFAQFLRRVSRLRGFGSAQGLARALNELDPRDDWLRQVKRWRESTPRTIRAESAALLGEALNANFASFISRPAPGQEMFGLILERLDGLEHRVAALER